MIFINQRILLHKHLILMVKSATFLSSFNFIPFIVVFNQFVILVSYVYSNAVLQSTPSDL